MGKVAILGVPPSTSEPVKKQLEADASQTHLDLEWRTEKDQDGIDDILVLYGFEKEPAP
jgi:hypothetical protein